MKNGKNELPYYRVWVDSKFLHRKVENIVLLPNNYNKNRKYPVLFMLVGAGNRVDEWFTGTKIASYASEFDMILATPNNGWQSGGSWYVDSTVLKDSLYETYIIKEFIDFMNSNYSCLDDRKCRAISGISMGGHGAFSLSAKYPDLFGSVSAFMGIMDLETWSRRGTWLHGSIEAVLGEYENNSLAWRANSVINLIERFNKKDMKIKFSCGTEDTVENGWGAFRDNERLHLKLNQLGVEHEYFSFQGGHSYAAIDCFLKEYLYFHYKSFWSPSDA